MKDYRRLNKFKIMIITVLMSFSFLSAQDCDPGGDDNNICLDITNIDVKNEIYLKIELEDEPSFIVPPSAVSTSNVDVLITKFAVFISTPVPAPDPPTYLI